MTVKRIRIDRRGTRRESPWPEDLPARGRAARPPGLASPALRACSMNGASFFRKALAFLAVKSISYSAPPKAKWTVSSAGPPPRSSSSVTITLQGLRAGVGGDEYRAQGSWVPARDVWGVARAAAVAVDRSALRAATAVHRAGSTNWLAILSAAPTPRPELAADPAYRPRPAAGVNASRQWRPQSRPNGRAGHGAATGDWRSCAPPSAIC